MLPAKTRYRPPAASAEDGRRTLACRFRPEEGPVEALLAIAPEAEALLQSNPGLGLAVACRDTLVPHDRALGEPAGVRALLCSRRRAIAGVLGFPASRAAVRVLARVELDHGRTSLRRLREAMRHPPTMKRLSHLPRITDAVCAALADTELRDAVTDAFLRDLSESPMHRRGDGYRGLWHDTRAMFEHFGRRLPEMESVDALFRRHARALRWVHALERGDLVRFGPPPVPGVEGAIEPLLDSQMLAREGRTMANCVGAPHYVDAVAAGELYLYRLLTPMRCTVAIGPDRRGRWRPVEIERAGNQRAPTIARRAVRAWLDAHRRAERIRAATPSEAPVEVSRRAAPRLAGLEERWIDRFLDCEELDG